MTQTEGATARPELRRRHTARWVAGVILVVGAALVALLATSPPQSATEVDTPLVGQAAPDIAGATLGGGSFDLAALRGRWVVVNFFASWCPPCQQEEPELVAFAYAHRSPGDAALVGVVFDDAASSAHSFMQSTGASWPAVIDPDGQLALNYGVRGPPETFIVAPDGTVVVHLDGPVTAASLDHWLVLAKQGRS
ncbi:MAG TPA: TlpA disulfide reductase family protein [Acidimicrobiales bacterium]|nr:TlpA disulfide reductase family protein [Acidimicrobiales bacterium]